ncbi:nucleotide exchange factor GrpE [Candidatus Gracilibacteria bacterium]|nr:nucleotide exchange factor GrpE [Candidatus Gracilibacteria bacterium]
MTQDTSDTLNDQIPQTDGTVGTSGDDSHNQQLSQLQGEIEQLREQLARSQADYNNFVRRSREEQAQISEWAENKTILKFLTILDNLERALEHIPEEFKSHSWTEGIISIVRTMQKTVTDFDISRMNSVGQEVDPDLHEVISQVPHQSTNIQADIESGYIRNGKALRHAKVIVGDGSLV